MSRHGPQSRPRSPRPVACCAGPSRWAGLALLAAAVLARAAVADPPDPKAPPSPEAASAPSPPPKELSAADSKRVDELLRAIGALWLAGKFADAIEPARQAAAIWEKGLGPDDWRSADGRRQVETLKTIAELPEEGRRAMVAVPGRDQEFMEANGKARYVEAERIGRQIVAVRSRWLGEAHLHTATSSNNLAEVLHAQGKLAEAEAMHRKALAIALAALGQRHPETAISYNNLALVLHAQGKLAEAEAMHRKALAIALAALGQRHPHTARGYNNLGEVLRAQGKLAEAEAMHRNALAIVLAALGQRHRHTARVSNNLAVVLHAQGKLAEAEAMHRKALAIALEALGQAHPDTARDYNNLGEVLRAQGKLAEAEAMHRKALAIWLTAVGEGHPHTALSYHNLGHVLDRLGKADEARDAWTAAVNADELARLRGTRGLESATQSRPDPAPAVAVALARAGRAADAWGRWERGLARAVLDETAGRAARPLTTAERSSEADLLGRSQALDERIGRLVRQPRLNQQAAKRLDELRSEANDLRGQLLDLQQALEQKYGPLAGKPATFDAAQAALADDTALVGWVDTAYRHAACVVRRSGAPAWILIPGTGPVGAWTQDEAALARRLRDALAAHAPAADWRPLAAALARQRLGPLEPHLKGVRRVVVVNSPGLAGVPVEVLFAARGKAGAPAPMVAYVPSASMLVYLTGKARPAARPATLLALGDPAYPETQPAPPPTPPEYGLWVTRVVPNGNADRCGVRDGDVLLEYNGATLKTRDDLKVVAADGGPKPVALRLWRAGEVRPVEVAAGPLGVQFDARPAADVVVAQRAAAEVLVSRAYPQVRLPGTRREVATIAGLFPADRVTMFRGDEARESVVQELARSGKLERFRYLHFAVHGRDDPRSAYRTALILAPDPDRSADSDAFEADGEVTAEQIARTWELDAELVVLSACETALGRPACGEGFLGFAQPLLAKGAHSLVLSLWRVDDQATAPLMARFYQNLLGRRDGLPRPLPKAAALAEAKSWLRGRPRDEARNLVDRMDADAERTLGRPRRKPSQPAPVIPSGPGDERLYDHPYYWAAFILVGDPD